MVPLQFVSDANEHPGAGLLQAALNLGRELAARLVARGGGNQSLIHPDRATRVLPQ